jgi:acyl-CoA synthetase (NDP forming)
MASDSLAEALFRPQNIALVGASGDATKNTARPQRYLRKHGYGGRIIPINPGREEVLGETAYPDIASAPGPVDHAFIMVPADAVPAVIDDCCRAGVRVATVYSDGFAETGADGLRRQRALVEAAHKGGVRLIGPNSMGVIDVHAGSPLTVNAVLEIPRIKPGPLGVISQSGTMIGAMISRGQERGMGFSKLVSIGNEADLTVGEIGDMLVDDPETSAILMFLESIRDPEALAIMARRAFAAEKPVIVYKLGRSQAGRALAISHSGAIAGDDAACDAYFRHHGIIRIEMLETLLEIPPLIMGRRPAPGRRVAVLTTTGGGAATVVDRLGASGMELIPATAGLKERLAPLGIAIGDGPIIDLTMAGTRSTVYQTALEGLLAESDCDAVVAVVGSSAQFHPQLAVEPIITAAKASKTPLAAFLVPQAGESLSLLADAGIAGFRTPEACADAVRAYLGWFGPRPHAPANPGRSLDDAMAILSQAQGNVLDELAARQMFDALGIPQAPAQMLDEAAPQSDIKYPVAAKMISPDIAHKTEAGGVVLGIADSDALMEAATEIRRRVADRRPDAAITGIVVQPMQTGLAEVMIGYRHTAEVGPIVTLAVGGTLAEIYGDASIRLAPTDLETALEMIAEVRGLAPIRGFRGHAKGDCQALAAAIVAISNLARIEPSQQRVQEAEINPLIVKADCVIAVDGLIVLHAGDREPFV